MTLGIFQVIITKAVLISITAVAGITRQFLRLPFFCATAATITGLVIGAHAWLTCIDRSLVFWRMEIANREAKGFRVVQDFFQKIVDVELDGNASVFDIAETGGL